MRNGKSKEVFVWEITKKYSFELGFATFYMNRTNRSGIIKGGVMGGIKQSGLWKLDARFNRQTLRSRIEKIAENKAKIHLYNKDIKSFLENYVPKYEKAALIYFDPPYFKQGKQLYLNFFDYDDHVRLEKLIGDTVKCDWLMTYDDEPEIERIYERYCIKRIELNYSAARKRKAKELIIFESSSNVPDIDEIAKNNISVKIE